MIASALVFVGGAIAGVGIMIPVALALSRRAQRRAAAAERRARAAERLAELGSMTGGLAHEIKNPLSTVGLNAQLLAEEIGESSLPEAQRDRLVRRVESLGREVSRLRDILTDFLRFAGRVKLDPHPRDIGVIVEELADFFHPQCEQAGVTLRLDRPPSKVEATVDEGLFKQAVLNLMINANQAMAAMPRGDRQSAPAGAGGAGGSASGSGGTGGGERRGERRPELILRLEQDETEVRLHVIDTGPGIPADKLEQIFLPYVSYKPGGTGLGLPTTRRIIEEHGGRISVHTDAGRGSDFTIHLPRG